MLVLSVLPMMLMVAVSANDRERPMPRIVVDKTKHGFVRETDGQAFTPWGFNYDHDPKGRLLEDYWEKEWDRLERDFRSMNKLGANVVRVHLQLGKFMKAADKANDQALARLGKLLQLAAKEGLYLDITGLGCYEKKDVPAWYDKLSEKGRWQAQARFWEAVAGCCARSDAVFCYDLMNEPVVPGGRVKSGDWLPGAFAGKYFVQFISLDQANRPRPTIARQWIGTLAAAVRRHDKRHLVTVGLVDWSLDRPGLTSGFVPDKIGGDLDFYCVHDYPEKGKVADAISKLAGFDVGKPVVIEETFPLRCSMAELAQFIEASKKNACGWIGFYWGQTPAELRGSRSISDAITLAWLEYFQAHAPKRR